MIIKRFGAVAHLVERIVRNDEVAGSIPVSSTILFLALRSLFLFHHASLQEGTYETTT